MRSRLSSIEKQIVALEQRPPAPVNILRTGGSPWQFFRKDPKVLRPDVAGAVERAFECGGFVAGGCARWLRSIDGTVTPLKRGTYVHEGGDIDLFFRTVDGWRDFLQTYENNEHTSEGPTFALSRGNLAANLKFAGNVRNDKSSHAEPPTVQAICCSTGEPEEMISGFDFHNSMVAFDRERSWVVDDWDDIQRKKELKVAWWGSRSIAHRVSKYMNKYGYHTLVNASNAMLEQLVAGTNSMDHGQKVLTRNKWMDNLHGNVCSLEMKLTILASTADGIEVGDIFELSKNTIDRVWCGSYENAIKHLLTRQEKANDLDDVSQSNDPPGFSADEYCWAV